MELPPPEVTLFLELVKDLVPALKPKLEPGGEKAGNWWIDFKGSRSIEWRPGFGFGIYAADGDSSYGEGPAETFRTPELAARRMAQLASPEPVSGFRALRDLKGVTQEQIAALLEVNQAAVSKLENRGDWKIQTAGDYVKALDMHLEVRVVSADASMCLYRSDLSSHDHAEAQSPRAARA